MPNRPKLPVVEIDKFMYRHHVLITSASLLHFCDAIPHAAGLTEDTYTISDDPVVCIMEAYSPETETLSFDRFLPAMAGVTYGYIRQLLDEPSPLVTPLNSNNRRLLTDALNAYQKWQDARREFEIAICEEYRTTKPDYAEHYQLRIAGLRASYKNWIDLNERFVAHYA